MDITVCDTSLRMNKASGCPASGCFFASAYSLAILCNASLRFIFWIIPQIGGLGNVRLEKDVEGEIYGVASGDAFGAADGGFKGEDIHAARAAVGEDGCFPHRFSCLHPDAHGTESPARPHIVLAYHFGLLFINVRKVPCALRSRPEYHF